MADLDWLGEVPDLYRRWYDLVNEDPAFLPFHEEDLPLTPPGTPEPQEDMAGNARSFRGRAWTFTVNNPLDQQPPLSPADLRESLVNANVKYAVFQHENPGTPHYQGYVEFLNPKTMQGVKNVIHRTAHLEPRRGTAAQARDYCMKEDTRSPDVNGDSGPWEIGLWQDAEPGKRTDLHEVRDAIFSGMKRRELLENYPEIVAKFPRYIDTCYNTMVNDSVEKINIQDPYPWQQQVLDMLADDPNPRQILWIYDPNGNTGKTYLATHCVDQMGAFYCNGGKGTDITYGYQGNKIAIFDYTRDTQDYVNYSVIEQIKNGIFFSPKYESGMKRFPIPHVMVCANFTPDRSKLSADRWVVIEVRPDKTAYVMP